MKNIVLGTALLSAVPAAASAKGGEAKQPNLLFIFADQYRRASLGFLGEDPVRTPNIDRLAAQGLFLSQAVSNHPLSTPFRGMLLTGQYPLTNGVVTNCNSMPSRADNHLDRNTVCFTDVLARSGYNVGYVGKWHLDSPPVTAPGEELVWDTWCEPEARHGCDFWYSYGTIDHHMTPHYWTNDTPQDAPLRFNQWSPEHEAGVIIDYLKAESSGFRDPSKPFAMFWSINPPHSDFHQLPQRVRDLAAGKTAREVLNRPNVRFADNAELPVGDKGVEQKIEMAPLYFAAVEGVDEQIGRVLDELRRLGLDENTIVVFASDHGEMMGSHGLMHKNIWFSESFDIPLIVSWPGRVRQGSDPLLISVPDWMPTFLGLMGLGAHIPATVEGRDYSTVFTSRRVASRPDCQLFFGCEKGAEKFGKRGVRTDRYMLAAVKESDGQKSYYLYDNLADPYQMTNIWGRNPKTDRRMEQRLIRLLSSMNDPWIE